MSQNMSPEAAKTTAYEIVKEEHSFQDWHFEARRSHIMKSACFCPQGDTDAASICTLCKFEAELRDLTQLPEMIFAENRLTLFHRKSGAKLFFDTLNAMKSIDANRDPSEKVKASKEWLDSRQNCPFIKNTIKKPYDWTFTSNYAGDAINFKAIEPTEELIDLELLKVREPIQFYQEMTLYEDELADNGCSQLTIKFRSMSSGFFILLRFYLRVDFVMAQIKDVRFHWRRDHDSYILREYQSRGKKWSEMSQQELALVLNPSELWQTLSPSEPTRCEKLILY